MSGFARRGASPSHFDNGVDSNGLLIAVTAQTSQTIAILGNTGMGKSHLEKVFAEGASLCLEGLSTLSAPQHVIAYELDYHSGRTRRQFLSGYRPNSSEEERAYLRETFDYRGEGDEAYHDGIVLTLPESVAQLRGELEYEQSRGLQVRPLVLGPQDLNMAAYRVLLSSARGVSGSERPRHMADVEAMISKYPDGCPPKKLMEDVQQSALRTDVKRSVLAQLELLARLYDEKHQLCENLSEPQPLLVLLETTTLSQDVLLPLQTVIDAGLSRPSPGQRDLLRWHLADEFNKMASNEVVSDQSQVSAQERRHRRDSRVYVCQRPGGLSPAFLGQASIVICFRLTSKREIRALKDSVAAFANVPDEVFFNLREGECLIAAYQSSGEAQVYRVRIRPTVTYAGGESLQAE